MAWKLGRALNSSYCYDPINLLNDAKDRLAEKLKTSLKKLRETRDTARSLEAQKNALCSNYVPAYRAIDRSFLYRAKIMRNMYIPRYIYFLFNYTLFFLIILPISVTIIFFDFLFFEEYEELVLQSGDSNIKHLRCMISASYLPSKEIFYKISFFDKNS